MEILKKLPFILSSIMTIIVGFISSTMDFSNRTIYIRMIVVMIVFYVIGIYLRNMLTSLINEVNDESSAIEKESEKNNSESNEINNETEEISGKNFDASTDNDEFSSEDISKLISENLDE